MDYAALMVGLVAFVVYLQWRGTRPPDEDGDVSGFGSG